MNRYRAELQRVVDESLDLAAENGNVVDEVLLGGHLRGSHRSSEILARDLGLVEVEVEAVPDDVCASAIDPLRDLSDDDEVYGYDLRELLADIEAEELNNVG